MVDQPVYSDGREHQNHFERRRRCGGSRLAVTSHRYVGASEQLPRNEVTVCGRPECRGRIAGAPGRELPVASVSPGEVSQLCRASGLGCDGAVGPIGRRAGQWGSPPASGRRRCDAEGKRAGLGAFPCGSPWRRDDPQGGFRCGEEIPAQNPDRSRRPRRAPAGFKSGLPSFTKKSSHNPSYGIC
jgi:hypothetical protein